MMDLIRSLGKLCGNYMSWAGSVHEEGMIIGLFLLICAVYGSYFYFLTQAIQKDCSLTFKQFLQSTKEGGPPLICYVLILSVLILLWPPLTLMGFIVLAFYIIHLSLRKLIEFIVIRRERALMLTSANADLRKQAENK